MRRESRPADHSGVACPHCGGAVAAGYAAVGVEGTVTPLFWVAGSLERDLYGGARVQERERAPLLALRCTRCAQVTFAAPPPPPLPPPPRA